MKRPAPQRARHRPRGPGLDGGRGPRPGAAGEERRLARAAGRRASRCSATPGRRPSGSSATDLERLRATLVQLDLELKLSVALARPTSSCSGTGQARPLPLVRGPAGGSDRGLLPRPAARGNSWPSTAIQRGDERLIDLSRVPPLRAEATIPGACPLAPRGLAELLQHVRGGQGEARIGLPIKDHVAPDPAPEALDPASGGAVRRRRALEGLQRGRPARRLLRPVVGPGPLPSGGQSGAPPPGQRIAALPAGHPVPRAELSEARVRRGRPAGPWMRELLAYVRRGLALQPPSAGPIRSRTRTSAMASRPWPGRAALPASGTCSANLGSAQAAPMRKSTSGRAGRAAGARPGARRARACSAELAGRAEEARSWLEKAAKASARGLPHPVPLGLNRLEDARDRTR